MQELVDSLKHKVRLMEGMTASLQSENAQLLAEASARQQNHEQLLQIETLKFESRILELQKSLALESGELVHVRDKLNKAMIETEKARASAQSANRQFEELKRVTSDTAALLAQHKTRLDLRHLTGLNILGAARADRQDTLKQPATKSMMTEPIEFTKVPSDDEKLVSKARNNRIFQFNSEVRNSEHKKDKSTSVEGYSELRKKHEDLIVLHKALQKQLNEQKERFDGLNEQHKQLLQNHQRVLADVRKNQSQSEDRIKQLTVEFETRLETSERDARSNQELMSQISALQSKVESLIQENTSLQSSNSLLTQQNSQLSNERVVSESGLSKKLAELESKLLLKDREIREEKHKSSDYSSLQEDLKREKDKRSVLDSQIELKTQEITKLGGLVDQYRSLNHQKDQEIKKIETQLAESVKESATKLEAIKSELELAQKHCDLRVTEVANQKTKNESLQSKIVQLESALKQNQLLQMAKPDFDPLSILRCGLQQPLSNLMNPTKEKLLSKVAILESQVSRLETGLARLSQAARARVSTLETEKSAVPLVAGGLDYAAFLDLQAENKKLKEVIVKVENAAAQQLRQHQSNQTGEIDRLNQENMFLKDQIRAFVEEMADISGANVQLSEEVDRLNKKGADDRERVVAMKDLLKKVVQQSQQLAEDVHKTQLIPKIPVNSALLTPSQIEQVEQETGLNGKKMLVDAVIEAKRLRSVVGLLERETTKLNSRIDNLQRQLKRSKDEKAMFVEANEKIVASMKEKDEEVKYLRHCLEIAGRSETDSAKGRIEAAQEDHMRQLRRENEEVKAQIGTLRRELTLSNKERAAQVQTLNSMGFKKDFLGDLVKRLAEKLDKPVVRQFEEVLRRIDYKDDFSEDYSTLVYLVESHRVDETLRNKKEELEARLRLLKVENQKYLQALQSQRLSQDIMSQRLVQSRSEAKGLNYIPLIMALGEEIERGNIQETKSVLESLLKMGQFNSEKLEKIMSRLNSLLD